MNGRNLLGIMSVIIDLELNMVFKDDEYLCDFKSLKEDLNKRFPELIQEFKIRSYADGGQVKHKVAYDSVIERVLMEGKELYVG